MRCNTEPKSTRSPDKPAAVIPAAYGSTALATSSRTSWHAFTTRVDGAGYRYLGRHGKVWKFGHGDANRVNAHLRAGADPTRVLKAPFEQVVDAERAIKRAYADHIIGAVRRGMPASFGAGTEVLPATVDLDIRTYLSGPQVEDVTHRFKPTMTRTKQRHRWRSLFQH